MGDEPIHPGGLEELRRIHAGGKGWVFKGRQGVRRRQQVGGDVWQKVKKGCRCQSILAA